MTFPRFPLAHLFSRTNHFKKREAKYDFSIEFRPKAGLQNHPKRLQLGQGKTDGTNGNNHAKRDSFDRGRRIERRNNHFVPPSSKFDVIRNPNTEPAEDNPCCDGQYESSDPFQGVCGRFGRGSVFCVEHDLCSLLVGFEFVFVWRWHGRYLHGYGLFD